MDADSKSTTPSESRSSRRWSRLGKWGFFAALLVTLVAIQWPMLKGMVYGVAPAADIPADQLPQWRYSYEEALAESKQTGRPVLIDFTASWCPPCRVMEREVWPDQKVRDTIDDRVIPLKLDVDEPSTAPASARYQITYIPTLLLVDGNGNTLARSGFMDAGTIVQFIRDHAPAPAAEAG